MYLMFHTSVIPNTAFLCHLYFLPMLFMSQNPILVRLLILETSLEIVQCKFCLGEDMYKMINAL